MTNFIEQLEKNSVTFANRLAVALDCKDEILTYGELWNLSGKVYAYLKNHNIGKEDFVLINLPRSPKVTVAMIGIWRAGAALTIIEKNSAAERVEYIQKDCNAKIVIDENIFNEMLKCEPLAGYEKTSPNDACFAVYTSGTTGEPKGALHEFGKLEILGFKDGNLIISERADDMIKMIEYLPPVTVDANKISAKANKKFHAAQAMQEKFFPAVQKAWEEYQQSGVVSSLYSSIFAADEKAMKKFSAGICSEITLLEKVDPAKLQAAVNKAVEVCPFAAFEISKRDGVVYFKKNNLPLLVGNFDQFGSAQNNYHYVIVSCEDRKIIVNVSHVLTDGLGIIFFLHALTDFYFDKEKTFYEGADKFDFVADLMAQELPLPDDYTPKNYAVENHFVPPEINSATGGKTYANLLEIQTKKFNNFCKKNRLSAQIGLSFLVARAVQAAHPDNEKIISVRSPVSTRTPLKVPNTFQNASIPHIFLNFEPRFLTGELSAENWKQIKADFSDQAAYENLAAFTNKIGKIFLQKNSAELIKTAKSYKGQTDIFANYMGKVLADDVAEYTEFFDPKIPATYPFMVYAITLGERIIFRITQPFEDKIYVESFSKCLQELGLME